MIEKIIFDWKRTLYNPDEKRLTEGSREVLDTLRDRGLSLVLIGRGENDMYAAVDQAGIEHLFDSITFASTKDDSLFIDHIPVDAPDTVLAVGDRAQKEVAFAKSLGAKAIWLRSGIFSEEMPLSGMEPDEVIEDIMELLDSPIVLDDK